MVRCPEDHGPQKRIIHVMPTLVLVRHGQSLWNLENRFTGWVDVPLTPVGEAEAKKAAEDAAKHCYEQALEISRHQGSLAFELRTMLGMCKHSFCSVRDLQPLLQRMVCTNADHDPREARTMLGLAS